MDIISRKEILQHVDHTLLAPTATWEELQILCDEAIKYETASVCVPPNRVKQVKDYLCGRMAVCTVVGFPNGYHTTAVKAMETEEVLDRGADEVDMVINLGWVKEKRFHDVQTEIHTLKDICDDKILKVIVETCFLTEEEKIKMCEVVTEAAYGIIANIALVAVAIFTGIAQGIQPLVSRFYSTGEADSLKKVRNAANLLALFLAAAFYAVIFLFSDQVIAVFNSEHNTALIPLAREGLRLYFIGFFFAGINIVMTAYLSAVELPKQGTSLSLLRGAILLVPLVLILPQFLEMTGVWLSFPLCELLTAGMLALLLRRSRTA